MLVAIPGAGGGGGRCFPLEACLCVQPDDWFGGSGGRDSDDAVE